MTEPRDELERRVGAVEHELAALREQLALSSADSGAARVLAAGADRDVSEVRAELRAHVRLLTALQEGQRELQDGQRELRGDVVELRGGLAELRGDVQELRGDVVELRGGLAELRGDVVELRGGLAELRGTVLDQGVRLGRIEDDVRRGFATLGAGMAEITRLLGGRSDPG